MKKQKYYLAAGVLACSAISGLAMPLANTFALGTGSQTRDVTVGEVDETVYSVDINWGDMKFDWKYAEDTNKFSFEPSRSCVGAQYQHGDYIETRLYEGGMLYQDSNCTTLYEQEPVNGATVYERTAFENTISIEDNSTNGKISVTASFTPEEKYNWINGEFMHGGYWTDGESLEHFNVPRDDYFIISNDVYYYYDEGYENGIISENPSFPRTYYANLHLKANPNIDHSDVAITASDKIGTVTITIEPDLN